MSFMNLPENVRIKIYRFLGLIRFCPIDLNKEGSRKRLRGKLQRMDDCQYLRREKGVGSVKKAASNAIVLHYLASYCTSRVPFTMMSSGTYIAGTDSRLRTVRLSTIGHTTYQV